MNSLSRRSFIAGAAAFPSLASAANDLSAMNAQGLGSMASVVRTPDFVRAYRNLDEIELTKSGASAWHGRDVEITATTTGDSISVLLHSHGEGVSRIQLRWRDQDIRNAQLFLGDHWERSYGDLGWETEAPDRVMPWYFLAVDRNLLYGFGVRTGAAALCFWNADRDGVSLWADVRNGGSPLVLGDRELLVCEVLCMNGSPGDAHAGAREFCHAMCPKPRLPRDPVYGQNDWYVAYGNNSAPTTETFTKLLVELSPAGPNRPYSVIDAGWSPLGIESGPWNRGNDKFGDMAEVATKVVSIGARPGIWFRPLVAATAPTSWHSSRNARYLDPTVPGVLEQVRNDVATLRKWGFELIKHDFSTFDILGRWGFRMGAEVTDEGWHFANRGITTGEAILGLYKTIREAAGDAVVIGCNTMSHLSAGIFELNRIGDDTSGRSWNRTRRMGVNALAFRLPQNGTFYGADPDVAAITKELPWSLAEKWLRLVSASGLPLFVSIDPDAMGATQRSAIKSALGLAAKGRSDAVPLDWMSSRCPGKWKIAGKRQEFDWMPETGSWPFGD